MENGTYRKTESCQRYRDWAQALKRNYEAVTAEQSTVSRARDLSTSTRTAQVDPQETLNKPLSGHSVSNDIKSSGPKDQFIRHSEPCWTTLRQF